MTQCSVTPADDDQITECYFPKHVAPPCSVFEAFCEISMNLKNFYDLNICSPQIPEMIRCQ